MFKCQWRTEHCNGAILNTYGKCIAECKYNSLNHYEFDCIGNSNDDEKYWDGREIQIAMRRNGK